MKTFIIILSVIVLLVGCASGGKYFQTRNPLSGVPLMQIDLTNDRACNIFLSNARRTQDPQGKVITDNSVCSNVSVETALAYRAVVAFSAMNMEVVYDSAGLPDCEEFVKSSKAEVVKACYKK
jgi:hypothetical protein